MSTTITECFGISTEYDPQIIATAAARRKCPFVQNEICKKGEKKSPSGVCTLKPSTGDPVICCPWRLYAQKYQLLREIAQDAFVLEENDFDLIDGRSARSAAQQSSGKRTVAVFGEGWGGELPIPLPQESTAYCKIDWILALLDDNGNPQHVAAAEVQTVDTTDSYKDARKALVTQGEVVPSKASFNWANVRKRIFQQIIYKSQVLEYDDYCDTGLYYVVPKPVFENNIASLGGRAAFRQLSRKYPGTITFFVYDFDPEVGFSKGYRPLCHLESFTVRVQDLQDAFIRYLPREQNLYYQSVCSALGLSAEKQRIAIADISTGSLKPEELPTHADVLVRSCALVDVIYAYIHDSQSSRLCSKKLIKQVMKTLGLNEKTTTLGMSRNEIMSIIQKTLDAVELRSKLANSAYGIEEVFEGHVASSETLTIEEIVRLLLGIPASNQAAKQLYVSIENQSLTKQTLFGDLNESQKVLLRRACELALTSISLKSINP